MPIGNIMLAIIALLIYFGLLERVLDRMQMTDRMALIWIAAMVVGSFVNLTVVRQPVEFLVNVGGGLIPLAWCVYLVSRADTAWEQTRPWLAGLLTAGIIFALLQVLPAEPTNLRFIGPMYLFGVIAGIAGYLFGRSRRSAFVAGIVGIIASDLLALGQLWLQGTAGQVWIGGAGAFDGVIIAGIVAVALAELFGETREALGHASEMQAERMGGGDADDG